jgi:glycosyltransferase involved in cell wall biosynthesis
VRVVADGSPLRDKRRDSGIGRYVAELARAMEGFPGVDFRLAYPPRMKADRMIVLHLAEQPWIVAKAAAARAQLVHATATNTVIGWPLGRQVVSVLDALMWTTHAPPPSTPTGRYLAFQKPRFARCAGVIVTSETVAAEAEQVLGVRSERIHLVPLGVASVFSSAPAEGDAAARRAAGVPERYVLWVGDVRHHDPRKSLDDLIEAVAGLGGDAPTLVLAGRAGEEAARLEREARGRGVPFVATGFVEDATLAALYRGARVVAVPSRHEGFGFPALEAFASGTPVVAAEGGNLKVLAGDAALLVPPGDVAGLSRSLRAALSDEALRARLVDAGLKRAAGYTWRRTAEMTAEVYRRALAAR